MSGSNTEGRFTRSPGSGDSLCVAADTYDLPNSIPEPVIFVIHKVLLRAFEILRENGRDLANASEDTITMWLRNVIVNDLWKNGTVRGFGRRTFEKVTRQQELENYNGTKIRPTPDMVFTPRASGSGDRILQSHYGLSIECKPVGPDHSASSKYCGKGVSRFVNGDYAWSMTEAMMVGYAHSGRTIAGHLKPAFNANSTGLAIHSALRSVGGRTAMAGPNSETLHVSEHRRDFNWPHDKGAACNLKLYHSWHVC